MLALAIIAAGELRFAQELLARITNKVIGASNVYAQSIDDALAAAGRGDYAKAMEIMRPLTDKGVVLAQGYIGILYRDGLGVQQNDQEAVKWEALTGRFAFRNSLAAANRQNDSSESPMVLKSLFAACTSFIVDLWKVGLLL